MTHWGHTVNIDVTVNIYCIPGCVVTYVKLCALCSQGAWYVSYVHKDQCDSAHHVWRPKVDVMYCA